MKPADRGAGRLWGSRGTAGQGTHDTTSIAAAAGGRKYGRCVCGVPISPNVHTLGCGTCAAWRKWFSAHLREASR